MITKTGVYKFVKLTDGKWKFWSNMEVQHCDMVFCDEVFDDNICCAAGIITVGKDFWLATNMYSMTLSIGCEESLYPEISEVLGRELRK